MQKFSNRGTRYDATYHIHLCITDQCPSIVLRCALLQQGLLKQKLNTADLGVAEKDWELVKKQRWVNVMSEKTNIHNKFI